MPRMRATVIAVTSLLVATLLTFPLSRHVTFSRDLLFVAAVIVVSRYASITAGLSVALASVAIFDWCFDATPGVLDFTLGAVMRAVVFTGVSILVATLERNRRQVIEHLETRNTELRHAVEEIKTLHGLLPICMHCKQIRTETEEWVELSEYVRRHSQAEFTHGICPECYRKHYPDLYLQKPEPK